MSSADYNKPSGHGLYFSGNFEIERKVSTDLGRAAEYRTYVVYLNCGGADRAEETRYEIRAIGYSALSAAIKENKVYFLRGCFYPSNTVTTVNDSLYFEVSDAILVGSAEEFTGDLINGVGVTGLGIITKTSTIVEECAQHLRGKDDLEPAKTTVVTVQHTEYHPWVKPAPVYYVEYRVRPYKYLSGTPRILQLGRECQFHGYLKDFNEETQCYVVIVNRVSTTCGHRDPSLFAEKTAKVESTVDGSGRPKPKVFVPKSVTAPFKSPIIPPPSTSVTSAGPAEFPEAPFSPSDSDIAGPPPPAGIPKKRAAGTVPKPRARARQARRTSSNSTLDLTQ